MPSRIVTYVHRPKRAPRKAEAAASAVPTVVTSVKRSGRQAKAETPPEIGDDPEADARVKAFFARMIRPP